MERLTDTEKLKISQFLKRITWDDIRLNAMDVEEAEIMRDAIFKMQAILAEMGFAPR